MKILKTSVRVFCILLGMSIWTVSSAVEWQQTNGPTGATVTAIQTIESPDITGDELSVLVGTTSGMFRSDNAGENWSSANTGLSSHYVVNTTQAPNGDLYAAVRSFNRTVVFKSEDFGETWTKIGEGLPEVPPTAIIATSAQTLLLGTNGDGVYRSTDGGETWEAVHDGLASLLVTALARDHSQTVFAGTQRGLHRLDDTGVEWNTVAMGESSNLNITEILVTDEDSILASVLAAGGIDPVYMSGDGGISWEAIGTGLPGEYGQDVYALTQTADGTIHAGLGAGAGVYSLNGEYWESHTAELTLDETVNVNSLGSVGNDLFLGLAGARKYPGILRSRNGERWQMVNTGLIGTNVLSLTWDTEREMWYAGTANFGVARSQDEGDTYEYINGELPEGAIVDLERKSDALCAVGNSLNNSFVAELPDGEETWEVKLSTSYQGLTSIAVNPEQNIVAVGGNAGVSATFDGGETWQDVNAELTSRVVRDLVYNPVTKRFYCGTLEGVSRFNGELFEWEGVAQLDGVTDLEVNRPNGQVLAADESNHIFAYDDTGRTIQSRDLTEAPGMVEDITILYDTRRIISSTRNRGVHIYDRKAHTWHSLNDPRWRLRQEQIVGYWIYSAVNETKLEDFGVEPPETDQSENSLQNEPVLIAGHSKWGVYKTSLTPTGVQVDEEGKAYQWHLTQNYPNPFNPVTTIQYRLPRAVPVSIRIYDLQGRTVATLLNQQHQSAGFHTIRWDARDKPTGMYIFRLTAGSYRATRKMVLIR